MHASSQETFLDDVYQDMHGEGILSSNLILDDRLSHHNVQHKHSFVGLNDTKAGMESLDKDRINSIIHEVSKDSPFYKHQLERERRIDDQISEMMKSWSSFNEIQKAEACKLMEQEREKYMLEARDLSQIIVHFDMDMFFAAVEIRDNPSLKDKPVAVGSMSMISTSNYVARKYGVRAAMAGFIAKELCPELILIPGDYSKYYEESLKIMEIIGEYDPNMSVMGCDEAYANLTQYVLARYNEIDGRNIEALSYNPLTHEKTLKKEVWDLAAHIVQEIRKKIFDKVHLTCSAGISTNTMLAKVCSDMNKPNGQFMLAGINYEVISNFVSRIRIRKIPFIGPVQERIFRAFNIETCQDLWDNRAMLKLLYRPSSVDFYLRAMLGIGSKMQNMHEEPRKSKSVQTTFRSTRNFGELTRILDELSKELSESVVKENLAGKTITLQLKKDTFESCIRCKTLSLPTNNQSIIFETAKNLLYTEMSNDRKMKIRNLGVRLSNFEMNKQSTLDKYVKNKNKNEAAFRRPYYTCNFCSTSFTEHKIFEQHVDTHNQTNINPAYSSQAIYNCPLCESSFIDLNTLNSHLDSCLQQGSHSDYPHMKRKYDNIS